MTLGILATIALLAVVILLAGLTPERRLSLAIVLIFASGGTGQLPGAAAYAFRGVALLSALWAATNYYRAAPKTPRAGLSVFVILLTCMLLIPFLAHGEAGVFLNALLGVALLALLTFSAQRAPRKVTINAFIMGSWLFVILSTPLIAVPSLGVVGANFRGIAENSNSLGIYCVLATASAIYLFHTRPIVNILAVSWPLALCIMSHSRTSLIAIFVLILSSLSFGSLRAKRFVITWALIGTIVLLVAPGLHVQIFSGVSNKPAGTRDLSMLEAQRAWDTNWLYGLGFSGVHYEIASSPLRAIAVGGAAMFLFYVLIIFCLLARGLNTGKASFAFAISASVHSLGEGWLISTTGPWVLAFACGIMAFASYDSDLLERRLNNAKSVRDFHLFLAERSQPTSSPRRRRARKAPRSPGHSYC